MIYNDILYLYFTLISNFAIGGFLMNKNQIHLSTLLSAVITNKKINFIDFNDADWPGIYEEAHAHEVHTLIYQLALDIIPRGVSNDELISKWKKEILISGVTQFQHIEQIRKIFCEFNKARIHFIALKGLVLRDLYLNPERRTMGDSDILIEQNHLKKAEEILTKEGYKILNDSSKHIKFIHSTHLPIELHRHLISSSLNNKNVYQFECIVWKNAKNAVVCSEPALILSNEDQILHLLLHMAGHLSSSGFGLRQLCDLSVITEKKRNEIDWDMVYEKTNEYGINIFTSALYNICNKLLSISIPSPYESKYIEESHIDCLIEDIFSGGTFGMRTIERTISSLQQPYINFNSSGFPEKKFFNIIHIIFPSRNKLGERYLYAKKYPLLVPAAWVHRIIRGIISRDFNMSEKKSFLMLDSTPPTIFKRIKLLHWLDLK